MTRQLPRVRLGLLTHGPISAGVDLAARPKVEGDLRYIRTTDIQALTQLGDQAVGISPQLAGSALVERNDILLTRSGSLGTSYFHRHAETMAYAGYLVRIRPNPRMVLPEYVAWWSQSMDHRDQINVGATRSTIDNFSASKFSAMSIPLPHLDVQRRLAGFLDRELAEIDAMDAELNHLTQTLQERATASVDQALSTVDRRVSLAWATLGIKTGPFGTQVKQGEYTTGGVPLVNPSHIRGGRVIPDDRVAVGAEKARELKRHAMAEGEIVVARRGELGRCAVIGYEETGFLCGTGSLRVIANPSLLDSEFAALCISSRASRTQMLSYSVGATMDNLNEELLGRVQIPLPPVEEQRRIVVELEEQTGRIDDMIADTQRLKALLAERRSTLITDVVTGKKVIPA